MQASNRFNYFISTCSALAWIAWATLISSPAWCQEDAGHAPPGDHGQVTQPPDDEAGPGADADDDADAAGDGKADAQPVAPAPVEFDRSVEGVSKAAKLFNDVVQVYKSAPAIRDRCTVSLTSVPVNPDQEPSAFEVPLVMSREGVKIDLAGIHITCVDGTMYGESDEVPDRIVAIDYDGRITPSLFIGQLAIFPFPQFGLCLSDQPLEELFFFTFDSRIAGYRAGSDEKDRPYEEIRIESTTDGAPCTLRIDPETRLVTRFEAQLRNPDSPDTGMDVVTTMEPELLDSFPDEEFIPKLEGRRMVDTIVELFAPPGTEDLVGAMSPAWEFEGYDQAPAVKLADGLGRVRLLAFWTFGSEAVVPVLPTLETLAKWVDEQNLDCDVIPVWCDVSVDDLDVYIKSNNLAMPIWMDRGAGKAIEQFQARSLPTTVVIGPNDIVFAAWTDTNEPEDMLSRLKSAVNKALEKGL